MEFNTDENRRQGKIRKYAGERKHERRKGEKNNAETDSVYTMC